MRSFKARPSLAAAACLSLGLLLVVASGAMASGGLKLCIPTKEGKSPITPKGGVCKAGYILNELGAEGKEGAKGEKGEKGESGGKGQEGKPGEKGEKGEKGETGQAGKPGEKGEKGETGEKGQEGKQGEKGQEGKQGEKGEAGLSTLSKSEQEALKEMLPYVKFVKEGIGKKPTIQFSAANVQIVNGEGHTASANGEGNLVIGYEEAGPPQGGSHDLVIGEKQGWNSFGELDMCAGQVVTAPFQFWACGPFTS